jgi:uncharacterized protein YecE (DUF72 family)
MSPLRVGLSGYSYKEWQGEGLFYPPALKQSDFLGFYATRYDAVEMDGSWYKTPTEKAVQAWLEGTPEGFQFSFKLHRRITHLGRLKPETYEGVHYVLRRLLPMARAGRLGPFLIQLPPTLKRNDERLAAFCAALPQDFADVQGVDVDRGMRPRWAVEFRDPSWTCPEVETILREHRVAWVASDRDGARADRKCTSDFHYIRLRRTDTDQALLDDWAGYFRSEMVAGRECFVYCKHEDDERPWVWADYLRGRVGEGATGTT